MKNLRILAASALLSALVIVLPSTPAQAADCTPTLGPGGVMIPCTDGGTTEEPGNDPVYTVPKPYKDYYYTPACSQNGPPGQGADAACNGFTMGCPGGDETDRRYMVYSRQMTAEGEPDGDWEYEGIQCRGIDDPPEGGPPVITTVMIADAARQAAPDSTVAVEPANRSYVNIPTNFSTEDGAVDVTVTVLGIAIPLRFTPQDISWAFGDGGSATGAGIAKADVGQAGAVEHEYRRRGDYDITVTRSFTVQATLPTGTVDIPGQIDTTSEPYGLDVGEIQSVVTDIR